MDLLAVGKTAGGITAVVAAMAGLDKGWDWLHSDFLTIDQFEVFQLKEQVEYHDIRLEEYQAVSEDKRDNTWNMRVGAHNERLKMSCDELIEKGIPNRICDNL